MNHATTRRVASSVVRIYSKQDCSLCHKLYKRLQQVQQQQHTFEIETCDITTNQDWWNQYQFTIPVVFINNKYWRCEVTLDKFEKNYDDFVTQLNNNTQQH
jgi:glutaredoxin